MIRHEGSQRIVKIKAPFAVGRFAITFGEWDACVADGSCNGYRPDDQGWGRGKRPVINVSFDDALAYAEWLSHKTRPIGCYPKAEREYVARAGTTTTFWWGDTISTNQAKYDGAYTFRGDDKGDYRKNTLPVDSFQPNPWGLYNVHGNVWEWCADVRHENYKGAPLDGSACVQDGNSNRRVIRGGCWGIHPALLRAATRVNNDTDGRGNGLGFRVARTVTT